MANEVYVAIMAGGAIWERGKLIAMTLTLRQVEGGAGRCGAGHKEIAFAAVR